MYDSRTNALARKLANRLIEQHNDLVFNKQLGGKAARILALFMKAYRDEMIDAIVFCGFNIERLKGVFTQEGIFAGTRDKPSLDAMIEHILKLEDNMMFFDVITDAADVIGRLVSVKVA